MIAPFATTRTPRQPSTSTELPTRRIEETARDRLRQHPHFRGRERLISMRFDGGVLALAGSVPTYYLKQLLQEALRDIDGVDQIMNGVTVHNPPGYTAPTSTGSSHTAPPFT